MSTAPIAQGPVDVNVRGLLDRLQARADNAYCDYIGLCRRDECLGWEAKVEKGLFGDAEPERRSDQCLRPFDEPCEPSEPGHVPA